MRKRDDLYLTMIIIEILIKFKRLIGCDSFNVYTFGFIVAKLTGIFGNEIGTIVLMLWQNMTDLIEKTD